MESAFRNKIPCIIHGQLPLELALLMRNVPAIGRKCTCTWCGCLCIYKDLTWAFLDFFVPILFRNFPKAIRRSKIINFQQNLIYICTSFWGLEEPYLLPPNLHLVGPSVKPASGDLLQILKEKDERIYNWLEDAHSKNQKVIYISIGSGTSWTEWSITAMKEGLNTLFAKDNIRAIWGFPNLGKGEGMMYMHPFGKDDDRVIV
jgi:hypothetical protein